MHAEPLNHKGSVKIFLGFRGLRGLERTQIAEPVGLDASIFSAIVDEGRLAIDLFFSENDFTFNRDTEINGLTHQFDRIISDFKATGFETQTLFIINIDNVDFVIGELDYVTATTDLFRYFTCKIIQETAQVIIKRREKVSVDLFSDRDLDDNLITPIVPSQMLIQALPVDQDSKWQMSEPIQDTLLATANFVFSVTPVITKSRIENTLSPLLKVTVDTDLDDIRDFKLITAENTLIDVTLKMRNWVYDFDALGVNGVDFIFQIGLEFDENNNQNITMPLSSDGFEIDIPNLTIQRNESLWVYLRVSNSGQSNYSITSGEYEVTSTSLSISSTANVVRFIDAFRQVATSIGGYTVISPRFDKGGEYFDQWITVGKLLRQITDDGFDVALKEMLGQLPEIYGDYQILDSNTIFLGIYRDFHTDNSMGSYTMPPNASFVETFSDQYAVNQLSLKFKNYEKENDEDKARQSVHTEIDVLLPNKSVENTKQVNIEFARDGFLIEKMRKDAILVTEDTATRDDNALIILESVNKSLSFTEAMAVQQVADGIQQNFLLLINDNSFNWTLMGIQELSLDPIITDIVTITGSNAGTWIVDSFTPNILRLAAVGGTVGQEIIPVTEVIQLSYDVTSTNLTQRIGDGFIDVGDIFLTNGAWSNKRIVRNYYAEYLRSASMFRPGEKFLVQRYIHNKAWKSAEPNEFIVTEGDNFTQTTLREPIVTPYEVETEVISDFSSFWSLLQDSKNVRGWVEIKTNEGNIIKVFPNMLSFNWAANLLTIKGLRKIE